MFSLNWSGWGRAFSTYFFVWILPNLIYEILFLPAGKICVKLHNVQTLSCLYPFITWHCAPQYFCSVGWIYTHIRLPLIVFLLCFCSLLHWRLPYGQFFICAEINFGRLPLSLSLSVCLEEEDDESDKLTFPFVRRGKEVCRKEGRMKTLFLLRRDSDTFYCSAIICDLYTQVLWKTSSGWIVGWFWCQDPAYGCKT